MQNHQKTLIALSIAFALPVHAQQSESNNNLTLEEVVVTAQKRAQTLQEVPVAVSAFGGEMLERSNIKDLNGLVVLTPGVAGVTSDSFNDNLAVRGIATNDYGIGGDPSIAVFKNGVWSGRNGGAVSAFYDMERAEVVKGPQATLFGRNAIAGAISTHTRKPTQNFEARVSAGVAERDENDFSAMINLPISDALSSRFNVKHEQQGGYITNTEGGDDLGDREVNAARASFRYENESLAVDWVSEYEERDGSPVPYRSTELSLADRSVASDLYAEDKGKDKSRIFNTSLNATLQLSENFELTSTTGYNRFNFDYFEDYDGIPRRTSEYHQVTDDSYVSQEFRLDYNADGNVYWFAGISAYQENIDAKADYLYDEETNCADIGNYGLGLGAGASCMDVFGENGIANKVETALNDLTNQGFSAFGDVTWSVTDRLDIIAGLRYTQDKKDMKLNIILDPNTAIGNFYALPNVTDGWVQGDETWSKTTGRLVASYDYSDDTNLYASYSQGYKSGGFQTFSGITADPSDDTSMAIAPKPYQPENVDSYEVGAKTRLFDRRVELNLAAYYFIYTDLQLLYYTDNGRQIVDNVGEVKGQGIEMEGRWLATEHWDFSYALGYGDSKYSDASQLIDKGICTSCQDKTLPNTPQWSGALFTTYTYPLNTGNAYATLEYVYEGERAADPDHTVVIDAWQSANLRIGYETQTWEATLWVENLFDELHFEDGYPASFWGPNVDLWPSKPRTIGVNFAYNFE